MKVSSSFKILVVDDSIDVRDQLKIILRKKGFNNIISANDGAEALVLMNQCHDDYVPVQMVLVDWQMPELDGYSLLQELKTDCRFSDVLFIMITGDADQKHVIEAINTGVNDYLIKPIIADVLLQKISNTIEAA